MSGWVTSPDPLNGNLVLDRSNPKLTLTLGVYGMEMEEDQLEKEQSSVVTPHNASVLFCDTQVAKVEYLKDKEISEESRVYEIKIRIEGEDDKVPPELGELEGKGEGDSSVPPAHQEKTSSDVSLPLSPTSTSAHEKARDSPTVQPVATGVWVKNETGKTNWAEASGAGGHFHQDVSALPLPSVECATSSKSQTSTVQEAELMDSANAASESWKDMRDDCMNYPTDLALTKQWLPSSQHTQSSPEPSIYQIKWISFQGSKCAIVTQNKNGPCPLISVVNVLLLTKRMHLEEGIEYQSGENLLSQLASIILESIPGKATEDVVRNYQQNIQDALAVLPKLQTGIDINVKFAGPRQYEFTQETLLFDLLNVPLVHGWIVDASDPAKSAVEKHASYNGIVEFIISGKSSDDGDVVEDALLAEDWLERTQSQLTYAGLVALSDCLTNDTPSVLFRNNHFSTIVKHKDEIYLLVTDEGYATETSCVWEEMSNIEGDTDFCDESFSKRVSAKTPPGQTLLEAERQMELDMQLALSLSQIEEPLQVPAQKVVGQGDVLKQPAGSHQEVSSGPSPSVLPSAMTRQSVLSSQSAYQLNDVRHRVVPPASSTATVGGTGHMPSHQRRFDSDHNLAATSRHGHEAQLPPSASVSVHRTLQHTSESSSKKDKCVIT